MRIYSALLAFTLMVMVSACGSNAAPTATPRPSLTPTLRSTNLPPVPTVIPMGSAARPYRFVAVTTDRSAIGSRIAEFFTTRTSQTFEAEVFTSNADALRLLCGDRPTAALLDGRGALAALAQGCGTLVFKLRDTDGNFGLKADIIIRQGVPGQNITALTGLRGRDFCRLSGDDPQSWVLPMLTLRTGGVNPAADLKGIKEYGNSEALLQGVADGICGGAGIPAGTLTTYKPRVTPGQALSVLTTTPELPYGGIILSNTIPKALADQLVTLIKDNPDQLESVLGVYKLSDAKPDDFADFARFAENAGLNFKSMQ